MYFETTLTIIRRMIIIKSILSIFFKSRTSYKILQLLQYSVKIIFRNTKKETLHKNVNVSFYRGLKILNF